MNVFPWKEFLGILTNGFLISLLSPLLWIIAGLIGWRYYRLAQDRNHLTGYEGWRTWRSVLIGVSYGIIGGWIGSMLMAFLGLSLNGLGIGNLWITAVFLMMLHPRFICFAYGGALIILSSLILGWPKVNGPTLLALIGSLHFVESILIGLAGQNGALPIWIRHKKSKEWVLGYRMEHFWPLPLLLLGTEVTEKISSATVSMPDWWPFFPIQEAPFDGQGWTYVLIPVVAALGYANVAISSSPKMKSRHSGAGLFIYSLILLLLAWLSVHYLWILPIGALFSALGHEGLIQLENRWEWQGEPMIREGQKAFQVVLIEEESLAEELGMEPGDQLVSLGDYEINSTEDLKKALFWSPKEFVLKWLRQGKMREGRGVFSEPGAQRRLGVLPLSEELSIPYASEESISFGSRLWSRIVKK